MLKKQIQKIFLISVTALILFSFLPTFITPVVKAETVPPRGVDCNAFDPTYPKTYESRVYVDKTDTTDTNNFAKGKADRTYLVGQANKTGPKTQILKGLTEGEALKIYAEVKIPDSYKECLNSWKDSFKFAYWTYPISGKKRIETTAVLDPATSKFFATITASKWYATPGFELSTYLYFCKTTGCADSDINGNDYIEKIPVWVEDQPAVAAKIIPPTSPLLVAGSGGGSTDPNAVKQAEDIKLKFTKDSTTGLRDKYRVLFSETGAFTEMKFGSNGLGAINLEWGNTESILTQTNPMKVSNKSWNVLANPYFRNLIVGLNYASTKIDETGCESGYFTEDCSKAIFYGSSNANGKESNYQLTLPKGFDPVLKNAAWAKDEYVTNKNPAEGQPMGSVEFRAIPIIWASRGAISDATSDWFAYVYATKSAKFKVEIYKSEPDIKKACENDAEVTDKTVCSDPKKMRYEVGKLVEVTTGTDQISAGSVGQTLYAFITRVISDLIVWLQSVIYRIFAYIVAPILNALLRVRPYQDAFVNVIYPGWLILRNLANIFFIVSLLVVGLRILFQQSAATAARGFIMRLIIMALLVNFSLVIGQGIIGIADTVQSQFLPGETRIIEALGHKLMVEPLKNFRAEVTDSESGVFDSGTAEKGLSDTVKPIVLLILSIASFFAFVAIAAFLTVRLVALWVLYMLSPIAYVGFVMDETQQYARKWWDEFIKYAIMTPVLVFFLNIAALMAMSFSSGNTDGLFKFSDGSFAGDIVVGSLSVLTHFIVLFFIFAGMKFALSSGTAGSKSIVKYAKKGFDAVTTRPAKWAAGTAAKAIPGAKDFVGDQASTGMGKLFGKRAENITQALFKPLDAAKKLKQGAWDRPGEDRKKRSEKRLKTIDDQSYKIMNNKWKSAKYAASTMVGQGPKRKLREGERKIDESQILTDDEKAELKTDLANEAAKKKSHAERLRLLQEKGVIDADKVTDIEKGIDQSIIELDEEDAELEKKYDKYTKSGDTKRADAVAVQRKDIADRKGDLEAIKDAIFNAKSITLDGSVEIKEVKSDLVGKGAGGEDVKLTAVFDPDAYKAMLEKEGKDIEAEESRLNKRAEEDERRRKDYPNRVTMDLPTRAKLEKEGMEIQEAANKRFLPTSLAERASRVADEREESKKLEDVDDADELTEMFGDAMRKNNMALATAISKKLAKEGNFDKLLNANGYENNLKSFQSFMDKHFKNMAPQARYQIASEVGHLASQNGNTTFVKPTKVQGGVMRWSTPEEHSEVKSANIEKASSYDLAKKKKWELGYQRNGKSYLDKTTIDSLNNMPKEKLKKMTERTSSKFIKDLVKFENYHELAGHVQEALESKK